MTPLSNNLFTQPVTIANGAALSGLADLGGVVLVGIVMPAAWTTAALTFSASAEPSTGSQTFSDLYVSGGTELSYTVVAAHYIAVDPANWYGIRFVKLRSGTGGAPVNQAADRILTLIGRILGV